MAITAAATGGFLPTPEKGLMFDGAPSARWIAGESTVGAEVGKVQFFIDKTRQLLQPLADTPIPVREKIDQFPALKLGLIDGRKHLYPHHKPGTPWNQVPRFVDGAVHADDVAAVAAGKMVDDAAINRLHNLLFRAPAGDLESWRPAYFEQAARTAEKIGEDLLWYGDNGEPPSVKQALKGLDEMEEALRLAGGNHTDPVKGVGGGGGIVSGVKGFWRELPVAGKAGVVAGVAALGIGTAMVMKD